MKIRTRIILILFISLIVSFVVFMNVSTLLYRSVDPGLIQQKISTFKEEIPETFDLLELAAFLGWRKDSRLSYYLKPINRAGENYSRKTAGYGLGLKISSELARSNGGFIQMTRRAGSKLEETALELVLPLGGKS